MRNNYGLGFVFEAVDQFTGTARRVATAHDAVSQVRVEALDHYSRALSSNQDALGKNATASQRASARVKDLEQSLARNKSTQLALKESIIQSGDADGKKKAALQGLATANQKLSGRLSAAKRHLRELDAELKKTGKSTKLSTTLYNAMGTALGTLGAAAATMAMRGIQAALVGSATAAIDFESSMADVNKVLPEGTPLKPLADGAKRLAKEIGIAPNAVAALTASLAQSGIAGEELLLTAEDASKLAVAFGISGEEAGQAIAKMRTGLGLTREQVNNLTGSINELSNNLAATAPEIVDAVQRVGSVAKAANISAETTAALATSMIASGAGAEVAATGTKNFIRALASGSAATKRQNAAFKALGLDAKDVAKSLTLGGVEAEKTVADVVTRIGNLSVDERLPNMIRLFGSESIGAIGPLATNIELLTKSFGISGNAMKANGSVLKEYETRSKTTEVSLKRLKANLQVLAIEFGDKLLPIIHKGIAALEWLIDSLRSLPETIKRIESVGPTLEKIGLVWDGLVQIFSQGGFSGTVRTELNKAENAGFKAFIIDVYALVERFRVFIDGFIDSFKEGWKTLGPVLSDLIDSIWTIFLAFISVFTDAGESASNDSVSSWRAWGSALAEAITTVATVVATLVGWVAKLTARFAPVIKYVVIATAGWKMLGAGMWFGVKAFYAVWNALKALRLIFIALKVVMLTNPILAILTAVAVAAYLIYENWEPIKAFFIDLWESVTGAFKTAMDWILEKIKWVGERIEDFKFAVTYTVEEQEAMEAEAAARTADLKAGSSLGSDDLDNPNYVPQGGLEARQAEGLRLKAKALADAQPSIFEAKMGQAKTVVMQGASAAAQRFEELKEMAARNVGPNGEPIEINVNVDSETIAKASVKGSKRDRSRSFVNLPDDADED